MDWGRWGPLAALGMVFGGRIGWRVGDWYVIVDGGDEEWNSDQEVVELWLFSCS